MSHHDGVLDFQTKMLLVVFSVFMLIFVVVVLVVGHFTWFAEIREKLERDWLAHLKAEKEKLVAQELLEAMSDPFRDDGQTPVSLVEAHGGEECDRTQCIPPHHSILCPRNPHVPRLHEPVLLGVEQWMRSLEDTHHLEWEAGRPPGQYLRGLGISVPVPRSGDDQRHHPSRSSQPLTPVPSPRDTINPATGASFCFPPPRFVARDLESGRPVRSTTASPTASSSGSSLPSDRRSEYFDISKIDMM